jgi:DNA-binding Xre family transcriptional regulator
MSNLFSSLSNVARVAGATAAVMGDEEAEKIAEKTRVKICSFLEADAKNITNNVVEFIK